MNHLTSFVATYFQPTTQADLDYIRDLVTDATLDAWHLGGRAPEWADTIRTTGDLDAIDWDALRRALEA